MKQKEKKRTGLHKFRRRSLDISYDPIYDSKSELLPKSCPRNHRPLVLQCESLAKKNHDHFVCRECPKILFNVPNDTMRNWKILKNKKNTLLSQSTLNSKLETTKTWNFPKLAINRKFLKRWKKTVTRMTKAIRDWKEQRKSEFAIRQQISRFIERWRVKELFRL